MCKTSNKYICVCCSEETAPHSSAPFSQKRTECSETVNLFNLINAERVSRCSLGAGPYRGKNCHSFFGHLKSTQETPYIDLKALSFYREMWL